MTESRTRTAVVTGTSSGLGKGVAERLVALGWDVLGTVRADGAELPFDTVHCDVTDDNSVARLGERVLQQWGRLDALVNNAGIVLTGPVEELEPAELRHQLDVNLVASLALVRACLPALRAASGVIVQVSSVAGYSADELFGPYNASKFGLEGASEALAEEVRGQGVRVVVVEPGPFRTDIAKKSPQVAGKGFTGLYEPGWRELDEWLDWHASTSPDAEMAAQATQAEDFLRTL
ncbi:MAG: SDR family NAD(P)-dependent oxidoreductase [Actinomycetia bacterium]|nr:SDR family NAD(P)-dependent oxidoreductase [Actinomycetes bacterium]